MEGGQTDTLAIVILETTQAQTEFKVLIFTAVYSVVSLEFTPKTLL